MNIKVLVGIAIFLLVAVIAIQLFVPKHLGTDGKISTFKKEPETITGTPTSPAV